MFVFHHGGIGEKVSNDHDSLSSKSGDNQIVIEFVG
jgi:hypothetical protein